MYIKSRMNNAPITDGAPYKTMLVALTAVISILLLAGPMASWAASRGEEIEIPEMKQIKKFKENVRRDGDTLYLKTTSGAYVTLRDTPACDPLSPCWYEFIDYFKDTGFYVLYLTYFEGMDHLMISDKDGRKHSVNELPMVSPDKLRVVTVAAADAFSINGVFVWRLEANKVISEFWCEPKEYALYEFIGWKDNNTVLLNNYAHSSKKLDSKTFGMTHNAVLKLEKGGWRIHDDLSGDTVKCRPNRINAD